MTDNQYQDLEWAIPKIKARIEKNKKQGDGVSISGLFKMLRSARHLSLIGDYFLFWIILRYVQPKGLAWALRKSSEYNALKKNEKMLWKRLLEASSSRVNRIG